MPRSKLALFTARLTPKRSKLIARKRFGGIELYAYGNDQLEQDIASIRSSIIKVADESGPVTSGLMRYLVGMRLNQEISQRIFNAILGSELRSGRLDGLMCKSHTGKAFRVVLKSDAKKAFEERLRSCLKILPSAGRFKISSIRRHLYPEDSRGEWTKAYYVASRLAQIGLIDFTDRFNIERSKDASNAIISIDESLYSIDRFRLG